ncbi:hypothetical protein LP420_38770 [Massilia sp. B-10]|nr:hypothetical protein LP420_38770 [Massilia sp. B-10]UUZ54173.1 hypothetical protein LP419_38230 [Massilia sp. H-1]
MLSIAAEGTHMTVHPNSEAAQPPSPAAPLTPDGESHAEHALDEALAESFPASDPVAIAVPRTLNSSL